MVSYFNSFGCSVRSPGVGRRLFHRGLVVGVFLALLPLGSIATAANGVRIGAGRLHPFVQTEAHYVYNPHRFSTDQRNDTNREDTQGTLFKLKPGARFSLPSSTVELKFRGEGELRYYAIDKLGDLPLLTGNANLDVLFNKSSTFPILVRAGFRRSDDPATQLVTYSLSNNTTSASLGGTWNPGGGSLSLKFLVPVNHVSFGAAGKDTPALELLDSGFAALDNYSVKPLLRASWRFLPKTAIVLNAFGSFTRYTDTKSSLETADFAGTSIALMGTITPRISTILKAGWAQPVTASDYSDEAKTFIGGMNIGYKVSTRLELTFAFGRDVKAAPVFDFIHEYYGNGGLRVKIGNRLTANAELRARYMEYGKPRDAAASVKARSDIAIQPGATLSYRLTEWLSLSLHNRLEYRDSGEYTSIASNQTVAAKGFMYFDSHLRVTARY